MKSFSPHVIMTARIAFIFLKLAAVIAVAARASEKFVYGGF